MVGALDLIRGWTRLAWWDGSCLDLRLHRLGDLIDFMAAAPEPARVRGGGRTLPGDRA
ncbi:hypothetical protein [Methylobacterium planeticum]|uniref:hypothetical protein n=1 Tax=Methylobacterium planeticum TaxID=2615211 RepID=UPI00177FA8EC|nr:hypothetical protein [Methylobacterium planeticum]